MRYAFLALLARGPAHGYELRRAFERIFGRGWPAINAGQIYTTLSRLRRDGLVRDREVAQDDRPDKRVYELTPAGHEALAAWLDRPVAGSRTKDELFMKLVLAGFTGVRDATALIDRQRAIYLQSLRELNDLAVEERANDNPVPGLLIEGALLHAEADVKWLDLCAERMAESGPLERTK